MTTPNSLHGCWGLNLCPYVCTASFIPLHITPSDSFITNLGKLLLFQMFCVSVMMSCSWYLPQIGCCSQWPAHIQFAWYFKQHQTFSLLDPPNKHHGFLPPPWRQGDRWLESFESWGLNSSLHSEIVLYSILFYVPLPCDTQNLANATAVCLSRGTVFDLNETLRSCRLAKNFGIKLGDCSTEHLAQVVVFILRFLKTCWDAFIVDSKIWRGHFPKSLWEWWLYANCEVSA